MNITDKSQIINDCAWIRLKHAYWLRKLEDYYGELITEQVYEKFNNNPDKDYILENLQTHDHTLLKQQILKRYSQYIIDIFELSSKPNKEATIVISTYTPITFAGTLNFKNLLEFYGYFIAGYEKQNGCTYIYIEPVYPINYNNYVNYNCHGIVYHITEKSNVQSVLKSGLRIRNSKYKGDYRNFPARIYLCASPKFNDFEMLKSVADKVIDGGWKNAAILKINVRNAKINFYKDEIMKDDCSFFTYHNIPPEWIVQELQWPNN